MKALPSIPPFTERATPTPQEDEYIRALLLLDGVTSVTLDRKREVCQRLSYHVLCSSSEMPDLHLLSGPSQVAVVFAYDAGIKAQLYAAVQETCDSIQDAAGKPRCVCCYHALLCWSTSHAPLPPPRSASSSAASTRRTWRTTTRRTSSPPEPSMPSHGRAARG